MVFEMTLLLSFLKWLKTIQLSNLLMENFYVSVPNLVISLRKASSKSLLRKRFEEEK